MYFGSGVPIIEVRIIEVVLKYSHPHCIHVSYPPLMTMGGSIGGQGAGGLTPPPQSAAQTTLKISMRLALFS